MNIQYRRIFRDELIVFQITGKRGDSSSYERSETIPKEQVAQVAVYVEGEVAYERDRTDDGFYYPGRKAGECTLDEEILVPSRAGKLTQTVVSDQFLAYCIKHPQNKKLIGKTYRLSAGDQEIVNSGRMLFIAKGDVLINGVATAAPNFVFLTPGEKVVEAVSDVIFLRLDNDDLVPKAP